jgi:hypothetical protein
MQGVSEDVNIRFVPRDQCPIHPDFFRFFHDWPC